MTARSPFILIRATDKHMHWLYIPLGNTICRNCTEYKELVILLRSSKMNINIFIVEQPLARADDNQGENDMTWSGWWSENLKCCYWVALLDDALLLL